ncbi:MAG: DUF1365 family protein [Arenicella sp.]|jgi:DUF1365 family protein
MRGLGIYKGVISHHRSQPREHRFCYRTFHVWVNLQRLDLLDQVSVFWSSKGRNLVRFKSQNYLANGTQASSTVYQRACDQVSDHTGKTFTGDAYLLANLSYWGYCYNPVAFVACYEENQLRYLIAEVHNTPWGERFVYVHDIQSQTIQQDDQGYYRASFDKSFHVSPFMPMGLQYRWTYKISESVFFLNMNLLDQGKSIFNATLDLNGGPLSGLQASYMPFRYPFTCLKVLTAIYWQALQLWLKKTPFHSYTKSR